MDGQNFIFDESDCLNFTQATFYYFELHELMFYIAILSCSSFIQLYFYFKFCMMLLVLSAYVASFQLHSSSGCLAKSSILTDPFLKTEVIVKMIFFVIFNHLIDRRVSFNRFNDKTDQIIYLKTIHDLHIQIEVNSRLDFLWRLKFKKEMDEVEVTSTMSRLLLENMLPKHVVGIILNPKRNRDEVYHEKYDNVAVMFASIPNFKEFYVQSDINKGGLECLRLLNEIIAEFDLVRTNAYMSHESVNISC